MQNSVEFQAELNGNKNILGSLVFENDGISFYENFALTRPLELKLPAGEILAINFVDMEKEMFSDIYQNSMITVDTSLLDSKALREHIEQLSKSFAYTGIGISFESFGFKYGIAKDADMVFDVRILDNPYYIEEMRLLNGNDDSVYDYVIKKDNAEIFLKKLKALIDYVIENSLASGKRHLTVAIGCTGGKHRSVSVARYLYENYKHRNLVFIRHRDINR